MLGAGEGNRTLVISLEGWNSTIELHPHSLAKPHAEKPLDYDSIAVFKSQGFSEKNTGASTFLPHGLFYPKAQKKSEKALDKRDACGYNT